MSVVIEAPSDVVVLPDGWSADDVVTGDVVAGHYNDTVEGVLLDNCFWFVIRLDEDALTLSAEEFQNQYLRRALRGQVEMFTDLLRDKTPEDTKLVVARPQLPHAVKSGSLVVDGIPFRWVFDYDPRLCEDRFVLDVYAGIKEKKNGESA